MVPAEYAGEVIPRIRRVHTGGGAPSVTTYSGAREGETCRVLINAGGPKAALQVQAGAISRTMVGRPIVAYGR